MFHLGYKYITIILLYQIYFVKTLLKEFHLLRRCPGSEENSVALATENPTGSGRQWSQEHSWTKKIPLVETKGKITMNTNLTNLKT